MAQVTEVFGGIVRAKTPATQDCPFQITVVVIESAGGRDIYDKARSTFAYVWHSSGRLLEAIGDLFTHGLL